MTAAPRRRGRPPGELSPEYQEVAGLYASGLAPREIAARLGRTPTWAGSTLQYLRSIGAIDRRGAATRAGRPPKSDLRRYQVTARIQASVATEVIASTQREAIELACASSDTWEIVDRGPAKSCAAKEIDEQIVDAVKII